MKGGEKLPPSETSGIIEAGVADEQPKRRGTDWIAARDFWLAQPPPRSFEAVGKEFGVSAQRVGFVARRDNWREAADKLDAQVLDAVTKRVVRSRADRVVKVLGIIDGALDEMDEQLTDKAREAKLRDLGELVRTAELLEGEATERMVEQVEVQEALGVVMAVAVKYMTKKAKAEFLGEVRKALGAAGDDA